MITHPLNAYYHMLFLITKELLRLPYSHHAFRSPSEDHSALFFPLRFHRRQLSWGKGTGPTYSPSSVLLMVFLHVQGYRVKKKTPKAEEIFPASENPPVFLRSLCETGSVNKKKTLYNKDRKQGDHHMKGTYEITIKGFDWGCCVTKAVLHLEEAGEGQTKSESVCMSSCKGEYI